MGEGGADEIGAIRARVAELEAEGGARRLAQRFWIHFAESVLCVDDALEIVDCNPSARAAFSARADGSVAGSLVDLLFAEEDAGALRAVMASDAQAASSFLFRGPDGQPLEREVTIARLAGEGPRLSAVVLRPPPPSLAEAQALRASEARFRQLAEKAREIIVVVEVATKRVLYVNAAYERLFGRSRQSVYEDRESFLEVVHPEDRERVRRMVEGQLADDREGEFRLLLPGGRVEWLRARSYVTTDPCGTPAWVIGVVEAITERRAAEEVADGLRDELEARVEERTAELHAANLALEAAGRLKDEFLASMSHELRTPLAAILGLAEALCDEAYGPLAGKQRQSLRSIEEAGRTLLVRVTDILDFCRLEAGTVELELHRCDVAQLCAASFRVVRDALDHRRQRLVLSIAPDPLVVRVDPERMQQVLVRLLSNAVKFSPKEATIRVDVRGDRDTSSVSFVVTDPGIGIAPEAQAHLFLPFRQLDAQLKRRYGGAGLGLSLVQRLTALHGGSVRVESAPSHGSAFTVVVPWDEGLVASNTPAEAPRPQGDDGRPPAAIVLADDDDLGASTFVNYLDSKGYRVLRAATGDAALELVTEARPDLVLMDVQLPGIDGLEAVRRLRRSGDAELAATPVVMLTAQGLPGDRERCMEAGANAYLLKPVTLARLIATIEAHRRRGRIEANEGDA